MMKRLRCRIQYDGVASFFSVARYRRMSARLRIAIMMCLVFGVLDGCADHDRQPLELHGCRGTVVNHNLLVRFIAKNVSKKDIASYSLAFSPVDSDGHLLNGESWFDSARGLKISGSFSTTFQLGPAPAHSDAEHFSAIRCDVASVKFDDGTSWFDHGNLSWP